MDRKKFIVVHTHHNEDSKKAMWEGAATYEESDRKRATNYTFARCRCLNNWTGNDDLFFCEWEAEDGQSILDAPEKAGDAKFIFTAIYEIDLHSEVDNLTDKKMYGVRLRIWTLQAGQPTSCDKKEEQMEYGRVVNIEFKSKDDLVMFRNK